MVKMRNPQAFQIQLRIEDEIFGEIGLQQLVVFRLENVERQRVAALLDGVNNFFEFSKHCLPEQRAAQFIDLPVHDVSAHLRIGCCLQQMMREQLFVERRCHFSEKNRILVILK